MNNIERIWLDVDYIYLTTGESGSYTIKPRVFIKAINRSQNYEVVGRFYLDTEIFLLFQNLNRILPPSVSLSNPEDIFYHHIRKSKIIKEDRVRQAVVAILVLIFMAVSTILLNKYIN